MRQTSRPTVAVVDYGVGNVRSVTNAFSALNCDVRVASRPEDLGRESHLVLPGVGAFGDGMALLEAGGWPGPLGEAVFEHGTPILGICLGMHLMARVGREHGEHQGLGWIDGVVDRIDANGGSLRVPHIGWNEVVPESSRALYRELGEGTCFYFLHSYVLEPGADVITGWCTYGRPFAASIQAENVYGVQFHPEKSHRAGLRMLGNFLEDSRARGC